MKKGTRRLIAAGAVLCAAASLAGSLGYRWESLRRKPVQTVCVERRDITGHVICSGALEYAAGYSLQLPQTLQVEDWQVQPGTGVTTGQQLGSANEALPESWEEGLRDLLDAEGIRAAFSGLTGQEQRFENVVKCTVTMQRQDGGWALLSPVEGVVTQITQMTTVPARTTLLMVAEPDSLQMKAQLPEAYVQDVAVGMPCTITGSAFRDRTYRGRIAAVAPFAYTEFSLTGDGERVVELTIGIEDADDALAAGYSAEAKIENYVVEDALFVPLNAVLQDENNVEYVYVIHMGRAFRRDVETGQELDDIVEIVRGLALGERVICAPDSSICDGAAVREGE